MSSNDLDRYEDGDDVATHQHPAVDPDLAPYDDDDVVTAPWPPLHS